MAKKSTASSGISNEKPRKATESQIAGIIRRCHSFLVCSHLKPDGDAVGSSVALALFLEEQGKEVTIYNHDSVPLEYRFLPGVQRIRQGIPRGRSFDVSFVIDCASPGRVSKVFEEHSRKGVVVTIDHHPMTDSPSGPYLIRTEAAAAGELLYEVYGAMIRAVGEALT